jgi:uncharacterized protein YraI
MTIQMRLTKMLRFSFTRRLAYFLTAGLVAAIFAFSPLTVVRAQDVALCAAPASALGDAYVTVNADQVQVNVRSGPNSYLYGKIGILFTYESAPVLGRSPGGDWFQISCARSASGGSGWVYAANMTLTAQGELPVVDIPITVTPIFTTTVDPTLAAAFPLVQPTNTRLPTFTPAVPQTLPTFEDAPAVPLNGNLQGALIMVVAALGLAVLTLSFLFKR